MKDIFTIVLVVLVIILILIMVTCVFFGIHNGKIIKKNVDEVMEILKKSFKVNEDDTYAYHTIRLYGVMKFKINRYMIENLGNLCEMRINLGVMQMETFVLTPYEKDMPMLSCDFIYILNKRKSLLEVYDLVKDRKKEEYQNIIGNLKNNFEEFADLADTSAASGWYDYLLTACTYKTSKAKQDSRINELFKKSIKVYTLEALKLANLNENAQQDKLSIIQDYCATMVSKGGTSTNVFKKALGDEITADFFNKVFFGCVKK